MNLYSYLTQYLEAFNYNKNQWHDVSISKLDKQERVKLWNLFKQTYTREMYDDMIFGNSMKKFYSDYRSAHAFILDIDGDKKMDAFIIYKKKGEYTKISLLGSNDKESYLGKDEYDQPVYGPNEKVKRKLVSKLLEILKQEGWFIEASLGIRMILAVNTSSKLKPIMNPELIQKVLSNFSNKKINYTAGGFYSRQVSNSGKVIQKMMFGNIKDDNPPKKQKIIILNQRNSNVKF